MLLASALRSGIFYETLHPPLQTFYLQKMQIALVLVISSVKYLQILSDVLMVLQRVCA